MTPAPSEVINQPTTAFRRIMASSADVTSRIVIRPVFVDDAGRRRKLIAGCGYLAALACIGYIVTVGISLTAGPTGPLAAMADPQPAPGRRDRAADLGARHPDVAGGDGRPPAPPAAAAARRAHRRGQGDHPPDRGDDDRSRRAADRRDDPRRAHDADPAAVDRARLGPRRRRPIPRRCLQDHRPQPLPPPPPVTAPRRGRGSITSWIVAVALVLGFAAILGVAGIGSARASNDAGAHPPVGTDTVPQIGPRRRPLGRRHPQPGDLAQPAPQDHRADLRRRPGPHVDTPGRRRTAQAPRAGHVLRRRLQRQPLPGAGHRHPRLGVRAGRAYVLPSRPRRRLGLADAARARRDPVGDRGQRGHHDLPAAAPLLLDRRRRRRPRLSHRARGGRARLRHGFHHPGQRGLAAARGHRDHRQRDPDARRSERRGRAHARCGRRPVRDRDRTRPVHPQDAGQGLPLHDGDRGLRHANSRYACCPAQPAKRVTCCSAWSRSPSGSCRRCGGSCSSSGCSSPCAWC